MPRPPISGGTTVWTTTSTSPSRSYSTKPSWPSTSTTKRCRSLSWRIAGVSNGVLLLRGSAIIALALVVAALGADAALGRLQPALGGVQFGGPGRRLLRLVAGLDRLPVAGVQLLPGRRLPIVFLLGFEQLAGVLQRLPGGDAAPRAGLRLLRGRPGRDLFRGGLFRGGLLRGDLLRGGLLARRRRLARTGRLSCDSADRLFRGRFARRDLLRRGLPRCGLLRCASGCRGLLRRGLLRRGLP